jgi:hypothetical protein
MTKIGAWQNYKTARLLRRLPTSIDQARPRVALNSRRVVRSPLRNTGSAYRDWLTGFIVPSIACQTRAQRTSPTERQRPNPHSF